MSDEKKGRTVLLTAGEWDKLRALADADRRTINAQIAHMIDEETDRREWDRAIAANREASEA